MGGLRGKGRKEVEQRRRGKLEMVAMERGTRRQPPVRVCLEFFYPNSVARVADAGCDLVLVIVQSPVIWKHIRSA